MVRVSLSATWGEKGVPVDDLQVNCYYDVQTPNVSWRQILADKYCIGQFT